MGAYPFLRGSKQHVFGQPIGRWCRTSIPIRLLLAPKGPRAVATGGAAARRSPPTRNPWK
jgi:hypothetical protein